MARNRRAKTSPEKEAPAPSPPEVKTENRPLWIPILSAASVVAILASSYFLLQIYAPSLSELPLTGSPGKAVVGVSLLLGVVLGLARALLKSEPLAPVRSALAKAVSLVFERSRVALILAPVALGLTLGTWWHWQASARCPILRIQPDGALAYYLRDAEDADKPPEQTFEIQVRWKDEVRRFHPRDDRSLDVGASESVLRWRMGRETQESQEEKDPPKRSYLGTDRFHAGDEVTIEVVCRKPGVSLVRVKMMIDDDEDPVKTVRLMVDEDEFSRKVGTCEPI